MFAKSHLTIPFIDFNLGSRKPLQLGSLYLINMLAGILAILREPVIQFSLIINCKKTCLIILDWFSIIVNTIPLCGSWRLFDETESDKSST